MTLITSADLARITGSKHSANLISLHKGLGLRGITAGLNRPLRLAAFLAQTSHESMDYHHDREIWGPTAAQKRYEGRADLGNTQPGDGSKFRGRTGIQITGRENTKDFRDWCRKEIDRKAPDFVANPELMNTDPWEGLGPIWFWETHELNYYADRNEFSRITRIINGGTNGAADRQNRWDSIALALLGYDSLYSFQLEEGLKTDGIFGPVSRSRLQLRLRIAPPISFAGSPASISASTSLMATLRGFFSRLFN